MIRTDLPWLVAAYLFVFLAAILVVWIGYEMARRLRERRDLRHRLHCPLCGMRFEDRSGDKLPRCPRCGNPNERGRIRTF